MFIKSLYTEGTFFHETRCTLFTLHTVTEGKLTSLREAVVELIEVMVSPLYKGGRKSSREKLRMRYVAILNFKEHSATRQQVRSGHMHKLLLPSKL